MTPSRYLQLVAFAVFVVTLAGCAPVAVPPAPPTSPTPPTAPTPPSSITPPPSSTPKQVACNTEADCVPNPSQCHTHSCVTKTAAAGMEKVEICTELFDYQAAYKPEDCSCQLGKCINKNLGRTSDMPLVQ